MVISGILVTVFAGFPKREKVLGGEKEEAKTPGRGGFLAMQILVQVDSKLTPSVSVLCFKNIQQNIVTSLDTRY